jgi:DNA-binding winged helix-turn-helix (wHTH) protein
VRQNIVPIEATGLQGRQALQEKLSELRGVISRAVDLLSQLEQQATPILFIDAANGSIRTAVREATLSPSEMAILIELASRSDIVPRDALLEALYPKRELDGASSLYVMLSSLRRKLKDLTHGESPIETIKGRGFRFRRDVLIPQFVQRQVARSA